MSLIGLVIGTVFIGLSLLVGGVFARVFAYAGLVLIVGSGWLAFSKGKKVVGVIAVVLVLGLIVFSFVSYTMSRRGTAEGTVNASSADTIPDTAVSPSSVEIVNVGLFTENVSTTVQLLVRVEGPEGRYEYAVSRGDCVSGGTFESKGYQDGWFITRVEFSCDEPEDIVSIDFDNDVRAAWNVSANRRYVG